MMWSEAPVLIGKDKTKNPLINLKKSKCALEKINEMFERDAGGGKEKADLQSFPFLKAYLKELTLSA